MVGNRSTVLARWGRQAWALTCGPRMSSGTRIPPSHTVPFPLDNGALVFWPLFPWSAV